LTGRVAELLEKLGIPDAELVAASMVSEMVGALALARAVPDREQSSRILEASRDGLKRRLGVA
jgi:TetR/AcrR family transcriptional repressor of nem operon